MKRFVEAIQVVMSKEHGDEKDGAESDDGPQRETNAIVGEEIVFPCERGLSAASVGIRTQYSAGSKGGPYAYSGMLLAWGITECIRYGFFVWKEGLGNGNIPKWLIWLRWVERRVNMECMSRFLLTLQQI